MAGANLASTASLEKEVKELKLENKKLQKLLDDKRKSGQLSGGWSNARRERWSWEWRWCEFE